MVKFKFSYTSRYILFKCISTSKRYELVHVCIYCR